MMTSASSVLAFFPFLCHAFFWMIAIPFIEPGDQQQKEKRQPSLRPKTKNSNQSLKQPRNEREITEKFNSSH
jgi:hypothetical protein